MLWWQFVWSCEKSGYLNLQWFPIKLYWYYKTDLKRSLAEFQCNVHKISLPLSAEISKEEKCQKYNLLSTFALKRYSPMRTGDQNKAKTIDRLLLMPANAGIFKILRSWKSSAVSLLIVDQNQKSKIKNQKNIWLNICTLGSPFSYMTLQPIPIWISQCMRKILFSLFISATWPRWDDRRSPWAGWPPGRRASGRRSRRPTLSSLPPAGCQTYPEHVNKGVSSVEDPWHFDTDPVPRIRTSGYWILLFSSVTFMAFMATKKIFFC